MHEMREKKTENLSQSIGMHGHYELYYFSSLFLFIFFFISQLCMVFDVR